MDSGENDIIALIAKVIAEGKKPRIQVLFRLSLVSFHLFCVFDIQT